jgi:hypothetical protein
MFGDGNGNGHEFDRTEIVWGGGGGDVNGGGTGWGDWGHYD